MYYKTQREETEPQSISKLSLSDEDEDSHIYEYYNFSHNDSDQHDIRYENGYEADSDDGVENNIGDTDKIMVHTHVL